MDFATGILLFLSAAGIVILVQLFRKISAAASGDSAKGIREELRAGREESGRAAKDLREEVSRVQKESTGSVIKTISEIGKLERDNLESVEKRIRELTESNESRIMHLSEKLEEQLTALRETNEKKLDQMRQTVDEKLQVTLEKRLGESFKIVSERLESVQRGLGEMQNLAQGVGDLKRVLTNVKARGTWGEVQLGAILEEILAPGQYEKNRQTKQGSNQRVEYAVRLPGAGDSPDSSVWLPIDSKFPQEDYLRLMDAAEKADREAVETAAAALARQVEQSAREISDKYLAPPTTTDFAIMFLPTEGLYAEVLRQSGLMEKIQRNFRVVISGPSTLTALLCSLRMGFRTLAIEQRSSEVWEILSGVKAEFGKFGDVLAKVKKQLDAASNTIDQTGVRTRAIQKKLRGVESLPSEGEKAPDASDEEASSEEEDGSS